MQTLGGMDYISFFLERIETKIDFNFPNMGEKFPAKNYSYYAFIDIPTKLIYNTTEYIMGIWHFNQSGIIQTSLKIL